MRVLIYKTAVFSLLIYLLAALFNVQVKGYDRYRALGDENRIRLIPLKPSRGRILDREGELLATNRVSFDVYIIPQDFNREHIPFVAEHLGIGIRDLKEKIKAQKVPYVPFLVRRDVPKKIIYRLEERKPELGGVLVQTEGLRYYPVGKPASHVVGYIGKITRDEYKNTAGENFLIDDKIGRLGVEKIFDSELRGELGGEQVEVDSRGNRTKVLGRREPLAGNDIRLTIDADLQESIFELLDGRNGAVALMDLKTDGMLAMVSNPTFDSNAFVAPNRSEERLEILRDKHRPMINRSVAGRYPPGSVFKLVVAMAALEQGKITPNTTFHCDGTFKLTPRSRTFHCWLRRGHGEVNLYKAIEGSCNVYFYNVAKMLGEENLAHYAEKFGFGENLALQLTNVARGLVPDRDWKFKRFNEKWYQGETINFGIGQGYLLVTPLEILRLVAAIANDGMLPQPRIVEEGELNRKKLGMKKENFESLKRAMLKVVQSDRGTGQYARVDFANIAGKTGTAQVYGKRSHAWFAGFFPFKDPKLALVVFLEHGGSGGDVAAKLARKVITECHELNVI